MDTSSVPHESGDEFLSEWSAQANGAAVHSTAKLPRGRQCRNVRLATLLLLATLAATFVLLRCHRQLRVGRNPGEALLRSLAGGEGAWATTPCVGAGLDGDETPDGVGNGIEPSMQQRVDAVMEGLEKVTKDLSRVARQLPFPFTMKLLDYCVGFCIQEVAALSTLLGEPFDQRKIDIMETVLAEAHAVMDFSKDRDWLKQQTHTNRVMNAARHLIREKPKHPCLPRRLRLKMLEDLLRLQELAISLINTVVSRVLRSNPEGELSLELTNEVTEEARRIVYLRRAQVFMSAHLSHQLRDLEKTNRRGMLVQEKRIAKIDARPKLTLDEQVDELIHVGTWRKKTVDETRREILEAIARKDESMQRLLRSSESAASERQATTPLLRSRPPTLQSDGSSREEIVEAIAKRGKPVLRAPQTSGSAASERQATTLGSSLPRHQSDGTSHNCRGSHKSGLSGEKQKYLQRHYESQFTQSASSDVLSASKAHSSGRRPVVKVSRTRFLPPRFQRQRNSIGGTSKTKVSKGDLGKTEASLAPETQPATGGFSHMHAGESQLKSYALPYQARTPTYRPGQSLHELGTAPSQPGVGLNIGWGEHASSGSASTSSLGTRLQRTMPGDPLEAPRQGWDAATRSGMATTPSWSPWSSNWPPLLPFTPPRQTPDSTSPTTPYTADSSEAGSSHQTPQHVSRPPWVFSSSPAPSPSSDPFTTLQPIASAADAMLHSGQSQEMSAGVQRMAPTPSRPHLLMHPSSISTASSLMMEQGVHSGELVSSVPMMSPRDSHSVGQGVPERGARSHVQPGASLAESQVYRAFGQEIGESALGESEWIDDDSDDD